MREDWESAFSAIFCLKWRLWRDHLVNIRSGRHNFVIVKIYCELEVTLRQLRGRLCLFTRNGLHIRVLLVLFFVFFFSTSVIQMKDDLMFGTSHSSMATREGVLSSILSFLTSLRLPTLTTQDETLHPLETFALCQRWIVFAFFLWLKHVISIAAVMSLRT